MLKMINLVRSSEQLNFKNNIKGWWVAEIGSRDGESQLGSFGRYAKELDPG